MAVETAVQVRNGVVQGGRGSLKPF
ncbi:hypothetical protein CCACVL1_15202 [Corchorus capsularis]|uniref:Uncharacterized protein n=1 Tax=Corchorus capsularis TaxID=210143 RepID=A0A1R3I3L8_COCAP|nr:hypothetical protein CCACVL1_15202 [Corchorus capsularis]